MLWWTFQQLRSKNDVTRKLAAERLGSLKNPDAVKPLLMLLHDKNYQVQASAIKALGQIGDRQVIEPLQSMLKSSSFSIRQETVRALIMSFEWTPTNPTDRALLAIISSNWEEATLLATESVNLLTLALSESDQQVQDNALRALGNIDHPSAVKVLCKQRDRRKSSEILEDIAKNSKNVDLLVEMIEYSANMDESIKFIVVKRLREMTSERAVDVLCTMVQVEKMEMRIAAVQALAASKNVRAVFCLATIIYLHGPKGSGFYYKDLSDSAAEALKELGPIATKGLLTQLVINEVYKKELERAFADRRIAIQILKSLGWEPDNDHDRAIWAIATEDWSSLTKLNSGAISALIANTNAPKADKIVQMLEDILKQHPTDISNEDLIKIALLQAKNWLVTETWVDDDGESVLHRTIDEESVNCLELNRLAQQYLNHRQAKI